MNVIERVIEEKNNSLLDHDAKKQKRDELVRELAVLDHEIESFDKNRVIADIEELTECLNKLNSLDTPVESQETCAVDTDTLP